MEEGKMEVVNTEERRKKIYTMPKIEMIADVREVTKGSTIGGTDAGGQSANVPSDPGGW